MATSRDFQFSPTQIDQYHSDGYFKAEGLFDSDEVKELATR